MFFLFCHNNISLSREAGETSERRQSFKAAYRYQLGIVFPELCLLATYIPAATSLSGMLLADDIRVMRIQLDANIEAAEMGKIAGRIKNIGKQPSTARPAVLCGSPYLFSFC